MEGWQDSCFGGIENENYFSAYSMIVERYHVNNPNPNKPPTKIPPNLMISFS